MLIAFSGLDGAGKSTQIQRLQKTLQDAGQSPIYLWTRGGYTPLFNTFKTLLRRSTRGRALPPSGRNQARGQAFSRLWVRFIWLRLAMLDLLFTYALRVRWWLMRGKTVICDRYVWDTLIDFRLNFPQDTVEKTWLWRGLVWASPKPDASFLMIIPVEESLRRSALKNEPFPDSAEVLAARREQYLSLSSLAGWRVMDGTRPVNAIASDIASSLPVLLEHHAEPLA